MSDFDTIKQMGTFDAPYTGVFDPAQIGTMTGAQAPDLSGMAALQGGMQDQQIAPPQPTTYIDPKDGRPKVTLTGIDQSDMQTVSQALEFYKKSLGSFDNRIGELQQRESQVKGNPIMNVLTQLAGQMAQAKDMPGWVQGAGRASLALNPTADALAHERLGLQKEQAGIAGMLAAAQDRQQQMKLHAEDTKATRETTAEARALRLAQFGHTLEKDKLADLDRFEKKWEDRAKNGFTISPEQYAKEAKEHGLTDQQIKDGVETINELNAVGAEVRRKAQEDKLDAKRTSQLLQEAIAGRLMEKKEALLGERQTKMANLRADLSERVRKELADYNEGLRASRFAKVLPPAKLTELEDIRKTELYFRELETLATNPAFSKYMGPLNPARISEWGGLKYFRPEEQQELISLMAHEYPRMVELAKAGVRGYSPGEQKIIKSLGGDTSYSPEQLLTIIRIARRTGEERRQAVVEAHPQSRLDLIPELLGGKESPAYKKYIKLHGAGPIPASATPPNDPEFKQMLDTGRPVRDSSGNVWKLIDGKPVRQ